MTRAGYAIVALVLSFGCFSFGFDGPVSAHHSFAAHYDMSNAITVQGTMTERPPDCDAFDCRCRAFSRRIILAAA